MIIMDDELFNNLSTQSKKFSEFESLLHSFVEELIDAIAALTHYHFYQDNPTIGFLKTFKPDKENIKKVMQSRDYFKIHGYTMCKEIQQIMIDFEDIDIPKGKALKYAKKEYPLYDESWVERQMEYLLKESIVKTPDEKQALQQRIENERAKKADYLEYQKAIHKELKKLVLKHCPHITGISGNGLRQIDYMLREYMYKITENMRRLIDY
jgi:hypothetical protein